MALNYSLYLRLVQFGLSCSLLITAVTFKVSGSFNLFCAHTLEPAHIEYDIKFPFHRISFQAIHDCRTNPSMTTINIPTGFEVPHYLTIVLLVESIIFGLASIIMLLYQISTKSFAIRMNTPTVYPVIPAIMSITWIVDLILAYVYYSDLKTASDPYDIITQTPACYTGHCTFKTAEKFGNAPIVIFVVGVLIAMAWITETVLDLPWKSFKKDVSAMLNWTESQLRSTIKSINEILKNRKILMTSVIVLRIIQTVLIFDVISITMFFSTTASIDIECPPSPHLPIPIHHPEDELHYSRHEYSIGFPYNIEVHNAEPNCSRHAPVISQTFSANYFIPAIAFVMAGVAILAFNNLYFVFSLFPKKDLIIVAVLTTCWLAATICWTVSISHMQYYTSPEHLVKLYMYGKNTGSWWTEEGSWADLHSSLETATVCSILGVLACFLTWRESKIDTKNNSVEENEAAIVGREDLSIRFSDVMLSCP